ncbi:MAG: class II glutamine amidotransferase [Gammaproteobacteria bacterium]|nr:class II glutamine amidotransferase [Gammaproteobacteria bacterium]
MCRWLAYSGGPIPLSDLVFDPEHSLVDQSLASRSSIQTTNGDGFGVGWYDDQDEPGLYKHIRPAWNDTNLKDLCRHTRSRMFLAHVRAATATAIQRSNCHPFRYGKWLFVHNGLIRGFEKIRRDLAMAIDPALYPEICGTTDSELMFLAALHFGMANDVYEGIARMTGLVEALGRKNGTDHPLQMTLGITDGDNIYAVRYSSERNSRTLYYSESVAALRSLIPDEYRDRLDKYSDDACTVVSEPFHSLPNAWIPVPEASFITVSSGRVTVKEFESIVA